MKKRFLAIVLALMMCISIMPNIEVKAATETESYSAWAQDDLIIGDIYGIYPQTWYETGMKSPIRQAQLRVLLAGLRKKILKTECITEIHDYQLQLEDPMTVEEVLDALYIVISGYDYTGDIGLDKNDDVISYMTENGIFNGSNGEQALQEVCSIEQASIFATRLVTYLYDSLDAASKGFFWEVESGENKVYLLGSIHLASYDIYPFSETIMKSFKSSDALLVELNMFDTEGPMALAQLGVYMDGTTLKDHVSEDTYNKTIELATALGYPEEQIAMLKPWYIYSMFSSLSYASDSIDIATSAFLGIDLFFTLQSMLSDKPLFELEGYEYQGKVLDSFSDELEEYLLSSTVDSVNETMSDTATVGADYLELILDFWHDGDIEAFELYNALDDEFYELYEDELTEEEKALHEEYTNKIITQRDIEMAENIDYLLQDGEGSTYFVVVGSGHYISDYSVLDILEEKGYEINQIK